MKIGIDARFWGHAGPGRYVQNLVLALEKIDSKNTYIIFNLQGSKDYKVSGEGFRSVSLGVPWYSFAEQIKLPFLFGKEKLDLLHVPFFNIPVLYPGKIAVTIHDLTIHRFSTARATTRWRPFNLLKRLVYRFVFWVALKKAAIIFTPTEFVKRDLLNEYGWLDENKIVVTYEGVDEKFKSQREEVKSNNSRTVLSHYGVEKPYLLYVGSMYPHKNLERLIESFRLVQEEYPGLNLVLVGKLDYFQKRLKSSVDSAIAGDSPKPGFKSESQSPAFSSPAAAESVVFPAFAATDCYVSDEDLAILYENALAFVFPSLSEGFGLPPLEAMQFGAPVCASNITAIPEVCGEAALYFDPWDPTAIAEAILALPKHPELAERGRERVRTMQQPTWDEIASRIVRELARVA
jgi:glycosyltransferase involved in cell wall biosynthesis